MAEEVKIVDVAGGPASEATLQELLKVMKGMSGGGGGGSGKDAAAKATDLYTSAVTRGTKAKTNNTKATKGATDALKSMASAASGIVTGTFGLFTNVISGGIGIATNLFKSFADGNASLTDMVSQVPIFGSLLGAVTGIFDQSLGVFQQLSSSGATFNNNLTQLRTAAAGARVGLETFASTVSANSQMLSMYGGTVTSGATFLTRMNKALGSNRQDLLNMGLSFEEINESMVSYMALNAAGSASQKRDVDQMAASAAAYTKQTLLLAKLTGKDAKQLKEAQAAKQADLAFQMKMATMSQKEKDKINAAMAMAQAQFGDAGAMAVKQAVLGMGPMTRETQLFASTMPEVYGQLQALGHAATDAGVSTEDFAKQQRQTQIDSIASALESAGSLEAVLQAGAAGLDGVSGELLATLGDVVGNNVKFLDENGKVDKAKIAEAIAAAEAEQNASDDVVTGLTSFQDAMKDLKILIETNIISPLSKIIGPTLTEIGKQIKGFAADTEGPFATIKNLLETFAFDLKTFGFKTALNNAFQSLKDIIGPWAEGLFADIKGMIFGKSAEDVKAEYNSSIESIQNQRKILQDEIDKIRTDINSGNLSGPETEEMEKNLLNLNTKLGQLDQELVKTEEGMQSATGTSGIFGGIFKQIGEGVNYLYTTMKEWISGIGLVEGGLIIAGLVLFAVGLKAIAGPAALILAALGFAAGGLGFMFQGIAAIIDSVTYGFQSLVEGLKELAEVGGEKLRDVGSGLDAIGGPLLKIAGAGVVASFISDGALENLAKGVRAFEGLDATSLAAVGPAMRSLHEGMSAFTGDGILDSLSKGIGGFISGLFGGGDSNFDVMVEGLKKFETVDVAGIGTIGQALAGISEFSNIDMSSLKANLDALDFKDIDLGTVSVNASGFEKLADITKTLDNDHLREYNNLLKDLIDTMKDLNDEFDRLGPTVGSTPGQGAGAGNMPVGASGEGVTEKLDELNNTMIAIRALLSQGNTYSKGTLRATVKNSESMI